MRQPSFAKFWTARTLSSSTFQMLTVAIGWQMYDITKDAFSLGYVGLAQFIPMFLLALIAGQVADRFDRRVIIALCQLTMAGAALFLLAGNYGGWLGRNEILAAAAVIGGCRAFEGPTTTALLPQIVPKSILQQAIAWSTSAAQSAQIVGPSLGGLLIYLGPGYAYGVSIATLLVAASLVSLIRLAPVVRNAGPLSLKSLFSGIVFIYKNKVIFGAVTLDMVAVFLGGVTALLPIFAQDILMAEGWGLGLLRASPAVGALLMSIYLAYRPLRAAFGLSMFGSLVVFGAATMAFALSTNILLSIVCLFFIGASDVISVVIRSTLVQMQTPDEMRGRVNAANSLFVNTSNQLGEFESGIMAGWIGAVPSAFIGGIGTIAVAGLWMMLFPQLRRLKSLEGAK